MADDAPNPIAEIVASRWFWITAGLLAAAVVGLTITYYMRHPEKDLFSDFARGHGPLTGAETNGHVPDAASRVGVDVVEGQVG